MNRIRLLTAKFGKELGFGDEVLKQNPVATIKRNRIETPLLKGKTDLSYIQKPPSVM